MKEHLKGSLGPTLNDLSFEVVQQANDLLERILDLETRIDNLEHKLSFIVFPHETKEDEDEDTIDRFDYTGGE